MQTPWVTGGSWGLSNPSWRNPHLQSAFCVRGSPRMGGEKLVEEIKPELDHRNQTGREGFPTGRAACPKARRVGPASRVHGFCKTGR